MALTPRLAVTPAGCPPPEDHRLGDERISFGATDTWVQILPLSVLTFSEKKVSEDDPSTCFLGSLEGEMICDAR